MGLLKELAFHPHELLCLIRYKFGASQIQACAPVLPVFPAPPSSSSSSTTAHLSDPVCMSILDSFVAPLSDLEFCYTMLHSVSRSFAIVIQQLPVELRDAVCVFYLVLRGLDTVEDDMMLATNIKLPLLLSFADRLKPLSSSNHCNQHRHQLQQSQSSQETTSTSATEHDANTTETEAKKKDNCQFIVKDVGDSHEYRLLLRQFYRVVNVLHTLSESQQAIIVDITRKMAAGMIEFVNKGLNTAFPSKTSSSSASTTSTVYVETHAEYNLYCHYVAGLVGLGLSQLFESSSLISRSLSLSTQRDLWNDMGSFLQKVNIIRDYFEDVVVSRCWWPREIWGRYNADLASFQNQPHAAESRACLNELILDALKALPNCLIYVNSLYEHQGIFRFCAIPQVMAACTMAELFDNPAVFTSVVKMRKGQTCDILLNCLTITDFNRRLLAAILAIQTKTHSMQETDESARQLKKQAEDLCQHLLTVIHTCELQNQQRQSQHSAQQQLDSAPSSQIIASKSGVLRGWSAPMLSGVALLLPVAYWMMRQPSLQAMLSPQAGL